MLSSASNTSGSLIAVVLSGTNIPLPNAQQLNNVTVNGANDIFTVQESGTYELEYHVYITTPSMVSSRILLNGIQLPDSALNPATGTDSLTKKATVNLNAGDTLSLQLYGLIGVVTLFSGDPSKATSLSILKK
ncbi:hypothetical protein QH639_15880 [Lysinibacillus sp. 1 U-2021]|uniref:BclA C-terminal domain-containing protein n=1 Tax=Lysinibacillus sp. 1 U-2021 TaxID=3039426 RepID=UPI00248150A7|nr:hypothetical protein [Lysinibacillus sp. 1 U-2021]WGT41741.1 hypothetical protein QH639_15880 [Lysinibacillus sp. 1 U-2021]